MLKIVWKTKFLKLKFQSYYQSFHYCLYHDQKNQKNQGIAYISDFWFHYKKEDIICRHFWSMPERLEKSSAFQWPFSGASKHHSAIYVWKCILSFHFPISILKKLHKNVSCYATVPLKKAMPKIITILSFHFPISILKKIYKNVSTVPLKKAMPK